MRVLNKIDPNTWESLQFQGFEIIQPIIDNISVEAYAAGECGDTLKYKTLIGAGMIIGSDDCKAWIVGDCEANQPKEGDYNNDFNKDFNVY